MTEAKKKYDDKFCLKWNVTWHIRYENCTHSIWKNVNQKFIMADLGHYIADAHMPFTSDNHDGQLTDQKGIHFVESRLPELFVKDYNLPYPARL
jgi:hypothetical protein